MIYFKVDGCPSIGMLAFSLLDGVTILDLLDANDGLDELRPTYRRMGTLRDVAESDEALDSLTRVLAAYRSCVDSREPETLRDVVKGKIESLLGLFQTARTMGSYVQWLTTRPNQLERIRDQIDCKN